jgi:hypothetical protein
VLYGEYLQNDEGNNFNFAGCGINNQLCNAYDSRLNVWGLGIVQEIDSAAMHVFARWQHLELDLNATDNAPCTVGGLTEFGCGTITTTKFKKEIFTPGVANKHFGKGLNTSFEDLDIFQVGGVIFF